MIKSLKKVIKKLFDNKVEIKQESLEFSQISNWIDDKEEKDNSVKTELAKSIKKELSSFIFEVNEKLPFLDNINLDNKKEPVRTKHIVLTNLKEYRKLVENLLADLKNFESLSFMELHDLINSLFSNFNIKSYEKYHKATHLIGKELGDINKCMQDFLMSYSTVIKENRDTINSREIIHAIRGELEKLKNYAEENQKIDSSVKQIKNEIQSLKQKLVERTTEIKKVESSDDHIDNLKKIKREEELQSIHNKGIVNLKQLIDFKTLSKTFHGSERYMEVVRSFRENFNESFKDDNGKRLLNLLTESKLDNDNITNKIKAINDTAQEIKDVKSKVKSDVIPVLRDKIRKIEFEINNLNDEINKHLKRNAKMGDSQGSIKESIREELLKLNIILEIS